LGPELLFNVQFASGVPSQETGSLVLREARGDLVRVIIGKVGTVTMSE
jgi:hypothetical protein